VLWDTTRSRVVARAADLVSGAQVVSNVGYSGRAANVVATQPVTHDCRSWNYHHYHHYRCFQPSGDAIPVPTAPRSACHTSIARDRRITSRCANSLHRRAWRRRQRLEADDCRSAIRGTLMPAPSPGPRPVKTIKASAGGIWADASSRTACRCRLSRSIHVGSSLRFRIFLMPLADSTSGARALQRRRTGWSLHGRISSTRQLLNYIHLFRADAFRRKPYGECNGWRITRENINPAMN
jgi:hypothetical protein